MSAFYLTENFSYLLNQFFLYLFVNKIYNENESKSDKFYASNIIIIKIYIYIYLYSVLRVIRNLTEIKAK